MKKINIYAQIALVFIGLLLIIIAVSLVIEMAIRYYPALVAIGCVGAFFAFPALAALAKKGGTYLYNKFSELVRLSTVSTLPYFDLSLTIQVVRRALNTISFERSSIKEVLAYSDIKQGETWKDGFRFLRFQVKRAGREALSAEDTTYLTTLIQDKVQDIIAEQYTAFVPFLLWNNNEWPIVTIDQVTQHGIYLIIDVIWVQDQRVADYLRQKYVGIPDTEETVAPTDSDF